jgi:hypothetical protein
MKNIHLILFILALSFAIPSESYGQVRSKKPKKEKKSTKKDKKEETISLMDKLNPEIKLGNLGFFNGLNVSTKMNIGYKMSDRFSVGAGGKLFYQQFSFPGMDDPSIFDYGGLVYGRGKITQEVYIQAEYAFSTFGKDPDGFQPVRNIPVNKSLSYPLIGLGYISGVGKWKFGIELMYIADSTAQDLQGAVVEYWFGGSYNF